MPSILIVTNDAKLPSFRYRMTPLITALQPNANVKTLELASKRYIFRILKHRKAFQESDLVLIQKIRLLPLESYLLHKLCKNLVMDIDDAIYANQPNDQLAKARLSSKKFSKFKALVKQCDFVSAGNSELAKWVHHAEGNAKIFPTGVDIKNYEPIYEKDESLFSVAWVGLPGNLKYLEMVRPVFSKIQATYPQFQLVIISSDFPDWPEINIKKVIWSSEVEKTELAQAHVGIMPLTDDLFSRGKCAFKILQYMAAGLPAIASPVGANCDVIVDGQNGFLADSSADWHESLVKLIENPALRHNLALQARETVENSYNIETIATEFAEELLKLIQQTDRGKTT